MHLNLRCKESINNMIIKINTYKDLAITLEIPTQEDDTIFNLQCLIDKTDISFTFCFQIYKLFRFNVELIDTRKEITKQQLIDELKHITKELNEKEF